MFGSGCQGSSRKWYAISNRPVRYEFPVHCSRFFMKVGQFLSEMVAKNGRLLADVCFYHFAVAVNDVIRATIGIPKYPPAVFLAVHKRAFCNTAIGKP